MIYIRELQSKMQVENLRLVAGDEGLERVVTDVVLLEYDPSRIRLPDFYEGDLVLTTLAYARGDEALLRESLEALIHQKIAGLLVKTAYFSELPESVLELADEMHTPIFLFDDTYIEEVLLQVVGLIREKRQFVSHEKEIQELLREPLSRADIRERLKNIGIYQVERYCILGIYPEKRTEAFENAVMMAFEKDDSLEQRYCFMESEKIILALIRLKSDEMPDLDAEIETMETKFGFGALNIPHEYGITVVFTDQNQIGEALCEACIATKLARYLGVPKMAGEAMGLNAYVFPMVQNPYLVYRCLYDLNKLREYDHNNHANLLDTARAFVQYNLDISETSRHMFQHINTIRYRLKKLKVLTGCETDGMLHAYLYLLVTMEKIVLSEKMS